MIVETYYGGWIDLSKIVYVGELDFGSRIEFPEPSFAIQCLMSPRDTQHVGTWSRRGATDQVSAIYEAFRDSVSDLHWMEKEFSEKADVYKANMNALHGTFIKQWTDYRESRHAMVSAFLNKLEADPNAGFKIAELMAG